LPIRIPSLHEQQHSCSAVLREEIQMVKLILTDGQQSSLSNALLVAAEKYEANAQYFRAIKPQLEKAEADNPDRFSFIHSSACDGMAEQFDRQAIEARKLMELVDEAEDA
jgi:hypothetical protein